MRSFAFLYYLTDRHAPMLVTSVRTDRWIGKNIENTIVKVLAAHVHFLPMYWALKFDFFHTRTLAIRPALQQVAGLCERVKKGAVRS